MEKFIYLEKDCGYEMYKKYDDIGFASKNIIDRQGLYININSIDVVLDNKGDHLLILKNGMCVVIPGGDIEIELRSFLEQYTRKMNFGDNENISTMQNEIEEYEDDEY